ncbi:MAG: DUF86 domain-containing protein [Armatimonadetes bacterium]|nr:DUF86 domain-containing protein [Armatimonadota bacterium]
MSEQVKKCLFDLVRAADDIQEFVAGLSFEDYTSRKLVRAAVEREMIIVGEAIVQLRRLAPEAVARLHADVGSIVAFRNRLVHGYDTVDDSIVFRVATRDLPQLRCDAAALQREHEP